MSEAVNLEDAVDGGSDANSLILTATSSFSSTLSSSDLDTESSKSFCTERSITLGSLIGLTGSVHRQLGDIPSSLPCSSAAVTVNCWTRINAAGSTASSQSLSFSHESCICCGARLWSLLPCGTCKEFCHAADESKCKALCCSNEGKMGHIVSSATGSPPPSSSLGRFLIAERDAESSLERELDRFGNQSKVYINIMYEESAHAGHTVEGAATINPLFDPRGTHTADQLCMSAEFDGRPSMHADVETVRIQAATVGETPLYSEVVLGDTPPLPVKPQETSSNNVCALGCVPIWAICRF